MNRKAQTAVIILVFILLVAFAFAFYSHSPDEPIQINSPQDVTHSLLPEDILTNNLTIICVSGYSATVRDVSDNLKNQVYVRDNVPYPQPTGSTELDHIVNLAIGGSNDQNNLWVQWSDKIVGDGKGFESKDKLENYLHDQVCNHGMDLEEAQREISTNWYEVYQRVYQ